MQEILVAASALKHGVEKEAVLHAVRNSVDAFGLDEGLTMIVGPARNAMLLEVGFIESEDGAMVAIHCMNVRNKYLRR